MTTFNEDPAPVERLTVSLTKDAAAALNALQLRTTFKKMDIINRALVIYGFLDQCTQEGNTLLTQDSDGNTMRLKFL